MLALARRSRLGSSLVILAALGAACDPGSIRLTPRVESVRLTAAPDTVEVGERAEFQAQVLDPSEHPLSGKRVYWGSSDTTVLQIDPVTGVARARAPGRVQIAASSEDKYAEATVEIPAGPTISFGTTMMDQLSANDDVDEFTFNGNAGQEFNVMLQGNSGVAAHRFRLRLLGPGRSVIDSVISNGNDPGLRAQAIKWLPLPQNGLYTVRIDGNTGGEQGSYRVLVEAINRAPEKAAATLTLPVSVTGESLTPGDVDIYTFSGTAGQEISATFSSSMGSGADALKLSVITPTAGELVFVQYNRDYTRSQGTGRRLLTQTGTYTIRVQGAADAEDQGDYNFQISIISRAPEVAAPGVALGTVVANEQIAPLGDFDEFTLAVPSTTQEVNVYLQAPVGPSGDSLLLRVLSPAGARVDSVTSTGNNTDLYGQAISHLKVGTGTYRLQVEGGRNTRGTYKFQVRPINLAPEHVSSTVTYGTLLTAEDISPVGDVDQFNLDVPVSATVTFSFQATSGKGADVLRLTVIPPTGGELFYLQPTGDQPGQSATRNLNPGKYVIRVEGVNSTDDSGFYRLQVVKVN